jgi:pimeloyl-ACP methyl ester carboxylesterase
MKPPSRPRLRAFASLLPLLGALGVCDATAAEPAPLKPCRVGGLRNEVLCGHVQRALDPSRPSGTQIDVHYVVVPAMARRKRADPVFLLAGGPGQSAINVAPSTLPLFGRLNNRRDIVFVDQRGTGRSAPLECDVPRHRPLAEQGDAVRQAAELRECRDRLKTLPHGDLRMYTTTLAMQDLDAVRAQLGVDRINLVGVSYGTRAALEYQRQFPQAVRRSVLDGVAPADMVLQASFSTDSQSVLDALFGACERDAACAKAHPALRAQWAALLKSLPKTVTLAHPLTGRPDSFVLTRGMVLGAVRAPLYVPAVAAALPHAIDEAARGNFEALAGMNSMLVARKGLTPAMGMHFSVVCAEDYPRRSHSVDVPGGDFGTDFAKLYERVCDDWPRADVPVAFYRIARSAAPTLVLSGGLDPVTPPRHGARVAKALGPKAVHVIVENAGHGVTAIGCVRDVMFRFIEATGDEEALAVDASCVKSIPRPSAFHPLELPAEAAPK